MQISTGNHQHSIHPGAIVPLLLPQQGRHTPNGTSKQLQRISSQQCFCPHLTWKDTEKKKMKCKLYIKMGSLPAAQKKLLPITHFENLDLKHFFSAPVVPVIIQKKRFEGEKSIKEYCMSRYAIN